MKRLLIASLLSCALLTAPTFCFGGEAFDRGWKCGWDQGWQQVKGTYSYPPYAPYPPYPPWDKDNFFGGYNLGFLAGMARAEHGY
jgi:hypothetical protein